VESKENELDQTYEASSLRRLFPGGDAQLAIDRSRVALHGVEQYVELGSYPALRQVGPKQLKHHRHRDR